MGAGEQSNLIRLPTRHETNLIEAAMAVEEDSAAAVGKIGFMARILAQITLPHSEQPGVEYRRACGGLRLHLMAPSDTGLPYGSYPRLILCWMTTEAVRTKSPVLVLGKSLTHFMRAMGLSATGGRWGTTPRLRDQLKRLLASHLTITVDKELEDGGKYFGVKHVPLVTEAELCWHPSAFKSESDLGMSKIVLASEFFQQVVERPVPIDMRIIGALSKSPLALDLYVWLTYRASYLRKRTIVSWEALLAQFGAGYPPTAQGKAHFRSKLAAALRKVELVWRELKIRPVKAGLEIRPCPPSVSRRDES